MMIVVFNKCYQSSKHNAGQQGHLAVVSQNMKSVRTESEKLISIPVYLLIIAVV
jgi:hypothetical protein